MFGFIVIKKSKYDCLVSQADERIKFETLYNAEVRKSGKLQDQISADSKAVKDDFYNLCNYHVLHDISYPCDHCKTETKGCKKLIFADRTICVCPKNEVKSFRNKNKKATKPNPKI